MYDQFNTESAIYVMNDTKLQFELLQTFRTSGGIDFEFADAGAEKYAIFLDHVGQNWYGGTANTYEKWFQVNQFLPDVDAKKPFHYKTKVRALGAKRVKIMLKENRYPYFITANSYYESGAQYHVKSTMHFQSSYGYELVQSFETQGAQDVEVFQINGLWHIVFANHQDNTQNVDIYSYVYQEQPREFRNSFKLYQRIETHGARDFEYFSFEGNHYLVVANEYTQVTTVDVITGSLKRLKNYDIDSVIYWWTGKMFVEFQRIPTQGAVRWSYFTSDIGHPMLVVSNTKSHAVIYTYDPLRGYFKPTNVQGLNPNPSTPDHISDVRSVMGFKYKNKTFLAVANYDTLYRENGTNIFELTFSKSPVPALDPSIPEIISGLLSKMHFELEASKSRLTEVLSHVNQNVMTKSSTQNITGNITFKNIAITDQLKTQNLKYKVNISSNVVEDMLINTNSLQDEIASQRLKLANIERQFADAVKLAEDAKIIAKKKFQLPLNVSNDVSVNSISINGKIDQVNLTDLNTRGWKASKNQTVYGNYNFENNFKTSRNLDIGGTINRKNTTKFFLTKDNQTVDGKKTFLEDIDVQTNLNLSNNTKINGLKFPDNIVTKHGKVIVSSRKSFNQFLVRNHTNIKGHVNGVNLTEFDSTRMTITTKQNIISPITMNGGFNVDSDLNIDGLVDQVNLQGLSKDLNNVTGTRIINGSRVFQSIEALQSVDAVILNGGNLSDIVLLDKDQHHVSANWTFTNTLNVKESLSTLSTINGLDISSEAVTIDTRQAIDGWKSFNTSVSIETDVHVNGTVDTVKLSDWENKVVLKSHDRVGGHKTFEKLIINNDLNSDTIYFNNTVIENPDNNLISFTNDNVWPNNLQFENVYVNKELTFAYVNNLSIPADFVRLGGNGIQRVLGQKTFLGDTIIQGSFAANENVNGKNINNIYHHSLLNYKSENWSGNYIFSKNVYFYKDLELENKVNNLSIPQDILTLNTEQSVQGHFTIQDNVVFNDYLQTGNVSVEKDVNGIDISVMNEEAIHKDQNQTLNGSVIFVSGISCKQNLSVAGLINGVNLTELYETTVRVSKEQSVLGKKTFLEDVVFESPVKSPGQINDIDLKELNQTLLKITDSEIVFPENITFTMNMTAENVTLSNTSTINNFNFNEKVQNMVLKSNHTQINGTLVFNNTLHINKLDTPTINNNIKTNEIITTNTNQTISSHLKFTNAQLLQDLIVKKLVNGINFTQFVDKTLKSDTTQNIKASYTFLNNVSLANIIVRGYMNGVNITKYTEDVVKASTNDIINGIKIFKNISIFNLTLPTLNGINVSRILKDTLMKDTDETQVVCHPTTMSENVLFKNLHVNSIAVGHINGVNITHLNDISVKLNEHEILNGTYAFVNKVTINNSMTIQGLVEGYNISNDFMTTTKDHEFISGNKTFYGITHMKNVSTFGLVDQVNLTHLYKDRYTLSDNKTFDKNIKFSNVIANSSILFPGNATLNNIDISSSLVSVSSNTTIAVSSIFKNVDIIKNVDVVEGYVNGVNLSYLNKNVLRQQASIQFFTMNQNFTKDLSIEGNMTVVGHVNNVQIKKFADFSNDVGSSIESNINIMSAKAQTLCNATKELMSLTYSRSILKGIETIDTINLQLSAIGEIDQRTIGTNIFLTISRAEGSGCGMAHIIKCSLAMDCGIHQSILTNANKMEFFDMNDDPESPAIFVSHWLNNANDTLACPEAPEILLYSPTSASFVSHQSINTELMTSKHAPIMKSSAILSAQFKNAYKKNEKDDEKNNQNPFENRKSKIRFFKNNNNKDHLVVASEDTQAGEFQIDIMEVTGSNMTSLQKKQNLKVGKRNRINVNKLRDGKKVLSASSGKKNTDTMLYTFNEKKQQYEFFQKITKPASSLKVRNLKDQSFLVYASEARGLGMCEWQGVSGFQNCQSVEVTETHDVETIVTEYGSFAVSFVADKLVIYETLFDGNQATYGQPIC